jgi:hypothetical protein
MPGSVVHLDPSKQHPIVVLASRLVELVGDWSRGLDAPIREAIEAGEAELLTTKEKVQAFQAELDSKRRVLIIEGLDRRALGQLRRNIAETATLAEDLTVGLEEARKALVSNRGAAANQLSGRVRLLAADLRDRRGSILSDRELDRVSPIWVFQQADATLGALEAALADCLREIQKFGEVPDAITATAGQIRKQIQQITRDIHERAAA